MRTEAKLVSPIARKTIAFALAIILITPAPAFAQVLVDYDFESTGQLINNFDSINANLNGATVTQSTIGGLSNSGSIKITSDNMATCDDGVNICPKMANEIYTSKSAYQIGPVGSTYTSSTYVKVDPRNGRFSIGFTSDKAANSNPINTILRSSSYYRPTNALGVTADSGSFYLHNGPLSADIRGWYDGWLDLPNNISINPVSPSAPVNDLLFFKQSSNGSLLNSGSPDYWYFIKFSLTRNSATTFNSRLEVWPSDAAGNLILRDLNNANLGLEIEQYNINASTLITAGELYAYFSFAGSYISALDEYKVDLTGWEIPTSESPTPTAQTPVAANPVVASASVTTTQTLAATGSSSSTWGLGLLAGLITVLGVASLRTSLRSREI